MFLVVVFLTCRVVEAGVKAVAVVEDALQLVARRLAVGELHCSDVSAVQIVYRHEIILALAFKAADIVDKIANAFHPLIEQACLFAFELHISDRLQVSVDYDDVVIIPQSSDIAVILLVIRYGGEAFVLPYHGLRDAL